MSLDLPALAAAVAAHGAVVRIVVARATGSAPREAGASMLVWDGGQEGTIGGGALEWQAVAEARAMLAGGGGARAVRALPLGPALGQCCGGAVTLVWERLTASTLPDTAPWVRALPGAQAAGARLARRLAALTPGAPPLLEDLWLAEAAPAPARPLWIWGAGHVGRALVQVLAPWPDRALTWVDIAPDRFPQAIPEGVTALPCADPARLVRQAPAGADHLILTHSHALDLDLCHALLAHDFASCGLIGSATKWARFRGRLAALGHPPAQISRIACPIGDPGLGKAPHAIALGVAVALLRGPGQLARQGDRAG